MITNIVKRDGRRKKFSITKIQNAITAALDIYLDIANLFLDILRILAKIISV